MKKEEHDKLTRAVNMYSRLTGESVDISEVKVDQPEEDAKAKQEQAQKELETHAEVTRKLEEADRAKRRLQAGKDVQPNNPGPNQTAAATEKAKAEGRQGEPNPVTQQGGK